LAGAKTVGIVTEPEWGPVAEAVLTGGEERERLFRRAIAISAAPASCCC
jgi:hypothetical protein